MNKTRIEWVKNPDGSQGFTWNPVTGCLHPCRNTYCYARRIAKRFRGASLAKQVGTPLNTLYQSEAKQIFPMGFQPTFYPHRLDEPLNRKKPATIFVCSMADLFGSWVPTEWIEAVLKTVSACPQHTFIFLTKNPERYWEFNFPKNCWLGATATDQESWDKAINSLPEASGFPLENHPKIFISAEPLLTSITPEYIDLIDWLIIGADSTRGAEKPEQEWGENLVYQAVQAGVPVFMKNNWPWPGPYDPETWKWYANLLFPGGWPQELPEGSCWR